MPSSKSNDKYLTNPSEWGYSPLIKALPSGAPAQIDSYLDLLHSGSAKAAAMLDSWVDSGHDVRIAGTADSEPGRALTIGGNPLVTYDLGTISELYYFNNHGTLVQEQAPLSIIHELSHMIDGTRDPTGPGGVLNDAIMNQGNYDYKGDILQEQNTVATQLGYTDNIQASYQATLVNSDPRFNEMRPGASYTQGNPIDDARIGSDGPDNMDHSLRTDNSSDLFLGLGGNDKLVGAGGADYLYGGGGNDFLVAGSNAVNANNGPDYLDGGAGDDLFDLRNNPSNDKIVESGNFGHDELLLSRYSDIGVQVDENTFHNITIPNGMPTEIDLPDVTEDSAALYFVVDHKITEWNRLAPTTPYYKEQTFTFGTLVLVDTTTGSSIVLGDAEETDLAKSPESTEEHDYLGIDTGGFGTVVFKDGAISESGSSIDLTNNANNTDPFSQWVAGHLHKSTPANAFSAESTWQVTLHSTDSYSEVNYDLYNRTPLKGAPPAPDTPGAGASNSTTSTPLDDGSVLLARYDASGQLAAVKVTEPDGSTVSYTYANGDITREVISPVGMGRTVFVQDVTGQSYTSKELLYDQTGVLTEEVRSHADGTPDYVLTRSSDGGQAATQYDSTGSQIQTRNITNSDGSRDSFAYTAGVLTRETQTHADGGKDIYLSNITGQTYVAEHRGYDAAGTLVDDERSHADGSLDYSYTLSSDGVVTKLQYDSSGELLQYQNSLNPDGSSDYLTYTSGVLTKEVQTHVDGSKDLFLSSVSGQAYTDAHIAYGASGTKLSTDETMLDGSHHQFAWVAGVSLTSAGGAPDTLQSASTGGDVFVFHSGFGGDILKGFHLDSDQIDLDASLFGSVDDMLQNHTTDLAHGALIQDGLGDSLLIQGVTRAQLLSAEHDFLLL